MADQQDHRILRVDPHCSVRQTFGRYGDLAEPADVEFANGRLFMADIPVRRAKATGGPTTRPLSPPTRQPAGRWCANHSRTDARRSTLLEVEGLVSRANDQAFWNKFPRFHYGSKGAPGDMPATEDRPGFFGAFRNANVTRHSSTSRASAVLLFGAGASLH